MRKSKSDELLVRIGELDKQINDARIASENFSMQAEAVASIVKMKEQPLEEKIIGLENVRSNYEELMATAKE
jgi:hypothetical protein